jgi:hypothetical protein
MTIRKSIALTGAALVIAVPLSAGVASAATDAASAAPQPACLIGTWLGPCHCPAGWHPGQSLSDPLAWACFRNK